SPARWAASLRCICFRGFCDHVVLPSFPTRRSSDLQEGWRQCRERIASGSYDVVILDELTYCLKFGWLDIDEVLDVQPAELQAVRSEEHTSELQSRVDLVCRLLLAKIKHERESQSRL